MFLLIELWILTFWGFIPLKWFVFFIGSNTSQQERTDTDLFLETRRFTNEEEILKACHEKDYTYLKEMLLNVS